MRMHSLWLAGFLAAAPLAAAAQQTVPATPQPSPAAAVVMPCAQAQAVASRTIEAASARLEAARQANSAATMRAAVDDLDRLLRDLTAQLAPCAAAMQAQAIDPHAGHAMPAPASPGSVPPATAAPAPADPHAGHVAPAPVAPSAARSVPLSRAPVAPTVATAPNQRPSATVPAPPTRLADLKCRAPVDPKTAPRMLYQGRIYYFCSDAERAAFAKDPGRYATPPGDAAPATHAH